VPLSAPQDMSLDDAGGQTRSGSEGNPPPQGPRRLIALLASAFAFIVGFAVSMMGVTGIPIRGATSRFNRVGHPDSYACVDRRLPLGTWTGRFGGRMIALLNAFLVLLAPLSTAAQHVPNPAAGRKLAENWCSSCHVVGPSQDRGTSTGAPAFAAVADMSSTTAMSLRVFLVTPHWRMPDLHLTRDEIDDITAYILSLKEK
jgi:mono/diheme cytochrome c family protein